VPIDKLLLQHASEWHWLPRAMRRICFITVIKQAQWWHTNGLANHQRDIYAPAWALQQTDH